MDKKCTVYRTANVIGKRWSIPVLLEIYKGRSSKRRFSELREQLPGITPKVLSMRLSELEQEKLLGKKVYAGEFPIRTEYSLTESGKDFIKIIKKMKAWALKWKYKNNLCESTSCAKCEL